MPTRINVLFPDDLLDQIRDLVPERKRSEFIVGATRNQLIRERQRRALELTAGAWRDESDPAGHSQDAVERMLSELREPDTKREALLEILR
jgi:hypothetical protein